MRSGVHFILLILILGVFRTSVAIPSITGLESHLSGVEIVYAMPYDFNEYSIYSPNSYATAQWQSAIMNGLYKRSSEVGLDWIPDLAAALPEISSDKKTFTIDLKPDLLFSDGSELDADDVLFSFRVALTPAINQNFYREFVGFMNNDSVIRINSQRVEVTLLQLHSFPFSFLSIPLIPEETFADIYDSCIGGFDPDCTWNTDDLSFSIGAGPYKASTYDSDNQEITVVRNDLYYGWTDGSATGNIEVIVFKKILLKDEAIARLVEGQIHIMDSQYTPSLDQLAFFPGITEIYTSDPVHEEISLNHLHPMFGTGKALPGMSDASDDEAWAAALKVRTAMSHIVDREFAANEISDGLAESAATSMPSVLIGWDPTLIPLAFDISAAKNLMEEAGFNYDALTDVDRDGVYEDFFFEITVLSANHSQVRNEWSAGYLLELPKIGIGVKQHVSTGLNEIAPRTFGWGGRGESLVPLYDEGGYDILFTDHRWELDWNPLSFYDASGRHDTTNGGNYYNFDIEEEQTDLGRFVRDYMTELNFVQRIQNVKLVQAELYKFKPVLPILYPQSHWGLRSEIQGLNLALLGTNMAEWELITKITGDGSSEPVTIFTTTTTTVGNEASNPNSNTSSSPINFIFGFGSLLAIVYRKRMKK